MLTINSLLVHHRPMCILALTYVVYFLDLAGRPNFTLSVMKGELIVRTGQNSSAPRQAYGSTFR